MEFLTLGKPVKRPTLKIVQRLVKGLKSGCKGGCWEWKGHRDSSGYGQIKINGVAKMVHRIAYAAFIEELPNGYDVHHQCCNTRCCNPKHLEKMLRSDNVIEGNKRRGDKEVPF